MKIYLTSEQHSQDFARKIAHYIIPGLVLTFKGEIGAGKTTFIRALFQELGVTGAIKSPTFSLVESYTINELHINHFDLYRVDDETELEYIGFRDYFTNNSLCCIEWPEKAPYYLQHVDAEFLFIQSAAGRDLAIKAKSSLGDKLLNCFKDE